MPVGENYDWLEDDGLYWSPETKAFWLDPETPAQVVSWFRRYRPNFRGIVECAGMVVEITDPPTPRYNQYANVYSDLAYLQHIAQMQYSNAAGFYARQRQAHTSIFGNLFGGLI